MIAIIADDFTGAAELAGISLRYGLKVILLLNEVMDIDDEVDVLVICSDSRSMQREAALMQTGRILTALKKLKPAFIYKKIDSVLRGYVIDEVLLQMDLCASDKVLILPANPSLGRTINNGEYFIDGKKITDTGFVNDPEFPICSSLVKEMVGSDDVLVLHPAQSLPAAGIVIGEAVSTNDIKAWASLVDESWMLAGAGDFYTVILDHTCKPKTPETPEFHLPHVYLCGTAFSERKNFIKNLVDHQKLVAYLPESINENWLRAAGTILKDHKKIIIAIDQSTRTALVLRTEMALAIKSILEREMIKEIFIEGGSTAAAVFQELKINKFMPINEIHRGVVQMKVLIDFPEGQKASGLFVTVKPGSYHLPEAIIKLYSEN